MDDVTRGHGKAFLVLAIRPRVPGRGIRTDFTYCGSVQQAIRRILQLRATGDYRTCFAQRMRITKGRKRGSGRLLLASGPLFQEAIR